jgi:hypothetical protein
MWYNIHGISSPFVLWIFGHLHYTKRRWLMLFLFSEEVWKKTDGTIGLGGFSLA